MNKMSRMYKKILPYFLFLIIFINNCARVGLVRDKYAPDFYRVIKIPVSEPIKSPAKFIIYSDNQSGWRLRDVCLRKSNWTSKKMLLIPFYQLYLLGNGVIGGVNMIRNVPDYGEKERLFIRDLLYEEVITTETAFILNVGDMVAADGRRPTHWYTFLKENQADNPLLKEIPYFPVVGNHEHANDTTYGWQNYRDVFDYPDFYEVEFENASLFVVNSNLILDQYRDIDNLKQDKLFSKWFVSESNHQKKAWLEQKLANCSKPFKIVAMHHSPISYSYHHNDWRNPKYGNNLLEKRKQLLQLFDQYNVQIVFSGHEHLYQHNIINHNSGNITHFLFGGGGGTPIRTFPSKRKQRIFQQQFIEQGFNVRSVNQQEIYHYYLVELNSTELTIQVIKINFDKSNPTDLEENIVLKMP